MSRTFDHEKYEEFVTAKARENEAAIKAALAVGGEPEVQLEIDALIWAEAEYRAVAEADRRIAEAEERAEADAGRVVPHRRRSITLARRAEEQSWDRLQAGHLEFS